MQGLVIHVANAVMLNAVTTTEMTGCIANLEQVDVQNAVLKRCGQDKRRARYLNAPNEHE